MSLTGKVVVVTRSSQGSERLRPMLEASGAEVLSVPTIEIVPPSVWGPVDAAVQLLEDGEFTWVAFTSAKGVDGFLSRLSLSPEDVFSKVKVAAVGTSTAAALEGAGIDTDLVPPRFTGEALADALGPGPGTVLLPRAEEVPPLMTEILRGRGWNTHEVAVYRTVPAAPTGPDAEAVRAGAFDIVTFTSASTARGFADSFGLGGLEGKVVACIGPVTAAACTEAGMTVGIVAEEHTLDGLVAAIAEQMGR